MARSFGMLVTHIMYGPELKHTAQFGVSHLDMWVSKKSSKTIPNQEESCVNFKIKKLECKY